MAVAGPCGPRFDFLTSTGLVRMRIWFSSMDLCSEWSSTLQWQWVLWPYVIFRDILHCILEKNFVGIEKYYKIFFFFLESPFLVFDDGELWTKKAVWPVSGEMERSGGCSVREGWVYFCLKDWWCGWRFSAVRKAKRMKLEPLSGLQRLLVMIWSAWLREYGRLKIYWTHWPSF